MGGDGVILSLKNLALTLWGSVKRFAFGVLKKVPVRRLISVAVSNSSEPVLNTLNSQSAPFFPSSYIKSFKNSLNFNTGKVLSQILLYPPLI